MKKPLLRWFKEQIDLAARGDREFLGPLCRQMVKELKAMGKDITRFQFKRFFESFRDRALEADVWSDYMILDTKLSYEADYSEVWKIEKAPLLPEVKGKLRFGTAALPTDFVKLGGDPEWVQGEAFPICEKCDCDMGLMVQIRSLPSEVTERHPELRVYCYGDAGTFYVFQCPQCGSSTTDWQCH